MENNLHKGTLIISRHAESEWNLLGKWTGLTDIGLTEKGFREAQMLGEALQDVKIDYAYNSELKRTLQTLEGILSGSNQPDIKHEIRKAINERDYGDLTGKNKWEVQAEIGDEAFNGIRRGWDYPVPGGETLKDVYERVIPFFIDEIVPRLSAGENILLVAHGNSIRALIKYLDNIADEDIAGVEMAFGSILLYEFSQEGKVAGKQIRQIDTTPPKA